LTDKIVVLNDNDMPVVEIGPTREGNGAIKVYRGDGAVSLTLGHLDHESGLYVESPAGESRSRQSVLGDVSKLAANRRLEWLRGILSNRAEGKK
jgi:hypothetical protein